MINDPEGNGGHESSSHITEVDIVGRPAVVHSPNLALVFTPVVAFILTFDSKSSSHITTMDFFFSHQSAKVLIASHRDLVSSAIIRKLQQFGFTNLILWTHTELSLTRWEDVVQADYFSCKIWGETQSFWEKKKISGAASKTGKLTLKMTKMETVHDYEGHISCSPQMNEVLAYWILFKSRVGWTAMDQLWYSCI